jgi:hypothetical protein
MDYSAFRRRAQETQNKIKDKVFKKKEQEKKEDKKEEWVVNTAAEYLFNEGLNEDGLQIFIEELGLESFVEFVYDLAEDVDLHEERAAKRYKYKKGETKETRIAAAREKAGLSVKKSTKSALDTAKEKQPEKKPVKSTLAKGVADTLARGALSAWQGHKAAMKKKKEGGSVASQIGAGLGAATGAMLKKGKKHLSDDYQYSDWREDFKAMEYEFIDIIEAEPLVTEASFEINPQKHREEVKAKKIRDRTKTGDEGSEIAKKKVKGPKLMGEEVDKRRAPAELVARLSARREGEMAQDGPNKPAYDAKQRILAKTKAKRMEEEVEQIDEIAPLIGGVARVGAVAAKVAAKGAAKAAPIVAKGAIKGAKVTGKAISKGAKTVSKIGRKVNKAVDTADKATDVALKMKELDRREKVGEEVESIDELKCWKGYKRKKGSVPGAKGSCVKESEVTEAKDETEIGITGQPIPKKKRSPKKQYEFEKKRRENLGRNVGGRTYSADVAPYKTNPRVGYLRNEYEIENELGEAKHTPTKSDLEANIGGGNLQKLSKKASKRIDYDVDGDVDPNDKVKKKTGEYGEELPTPFGKFRTGDSKKVKVKKEEVSNWKDEIDEGWKSALAGAGLATAVALHGGGSKTDKKPQPKSQSSSVEKVSTQQKEKSAMDKWRKANPELAKRADNPKPFKRKKWGRINPEWAKAHPELAKKERARRAQRGSN